MRVVREIAKLDNANFESRMAYIESFQDLEVYKISRTLAKDIFEISKSFPKSRQRASSIRSCPMPGNSCERRRRTGAAVARTPRIGTSRSSGVASTRTGGAPSGCPAGRCRSSWYWTTRGLAAAAVGVPLGLGRRQLVEEVVRPQRQRAADRRSAARRAGAAGRWPSARRPRGAPARAPRGRRPARRTGPAPAAPRGRPWSARPAPAAAAATAAVATTSST